jgi:ABC-2 type transport system permease protein
VNSVVRNVRLLVIGGLFSYRAMFNWLNPWIAIPTFVVEPIFQVLLFAYTGRHAGVGSDQFYVIGNALNFAAIPCLFAMGNTIEGEREAHTLSVVFVTPAPRIPLFLGRALPVILNGWVVALIGVLSGWIFLGVTIPLSSIPALLLVILVASMACTGLGLAAGALCLRVRQGATVSNVIFCTLLVFTGVNVALSDLPSWMAHVGSWLPMTHAIEAAREVANGASLAHVSGLLGRELGIGLVFTVLGLVLLRYLETESRRSASLERV